MWITARPSREVLHGSDKNPRTLDSLSLSNAINQRGAAASFSFSVSLHIVK